VERIPDGRTVSTREITVEGFTPEQIAYHAHLLVDGGFLRGIDVTTQSRVSDLRYYAGLDLTWAGHEFLGAAKNNQVWRKALEATRIAGGWTVSLVRPYLEENLKELLP